jgi:hypothetical protein
MNMDMLESLVCSLTDSALGAGASPLEISNAERTLAVRFPPSLKAYLRRLGWLRAGHMELFGLGRDVPKYLDLVNVTLWERNESGCPLPHQLLPVHNDGAGNLSCIDTRSGAVMVWSHELGQGQVPELVGKDLIEWLFDQVTSLPPSPRADVLRTFLATLPAPTPAEASLPGLVEAYFKDFDHRTQAAEAVLQLTTSTNGELESALFEKTGYRFNGPTTARQWLTALAVALLS